MGSILKYWARGNEPLLLVWGNESTTPRQARLMGKHVNEGCFSYLGPQARGLIQETASLRSVIHPSTNLREGTTLPRAWDEVLAQRGMTNTRSSQGLQAEQGANLNSTNFWPQCHQELYFLFEQGKIVDTKLQISFVLGLRWHRHSFA